MRFWLSAPRAGWFRPSVSSGPEDLRRKRWRPVIVTEQRADPVELLYEAFGRLDLHER
jgi:hypothetical protein